MDRYKICVFCIIYSEDSIVLIERKKDPHKGNWIPPGGKVEVGESPFDTCIREVKEETGIDVLNAHLKGILTETSETGFNWINFIFVVDSFKGELNHCEEGITKWVKFKDLVSIQIPEVDKKIIPDIISYKGFYNAKVIYNEKLEILNYIEYN